VYIVSDEMNWKTSFLSLLYIEIPRLVAGIGILVDSYSPLDNCYLRDHLLFVIAAIGC
jgi:hypothetical protein